MPRGEWTTVPVKKTLYERAKRVVATGLGYRSVSDLVAEALRLRLEELERLYRLTPKPEARPPAEGCEGVCGKGRPIRANEARLLKEKAAEAAAGVVAGG